MYQLQLQRALQPKMRQREGEQLRARGKLVCCPSPSRINIYKIFQWTLQMSKCLLFRLLCQYLLTISYMGNPQRSCTVLSFVWKPWNRGSKTPCQMAVANDLVNRSKHCMDFDSHALEAVGPCVMFHHSFLSILKSPPALDHLSSIRMLMKIILCPSHLLVSSLFSKTEEMGR